MKTFIEEINGVQCRVVQVTHGGKVFESAIELPASDASMRVQDDRARELQLRLQGK